MKKLIDIPDNIRWKLEELALKKKMSLKKFIEYVLAKLVKNDTVN